MVRGTARLGGTAWWAVLGTGLALVTAVALAILFRDSHPRLALSINNLGETVAALWGAGCCAWGAVYSAGRQRRALTWLAAACGSWALGQAVWSTYELFLDRQAPFPSAADVGFLGFLAAAVVGVALLPAPTGGSERRQQLLDGLTVATAVTLISSVSTLGAVLDAGAGSRLALAISVAYPLGDILLITVTLLALVTGTGYRVQLAIASLSIASMTLADSAFAYLTALGTYGTGSMVDVGWCVAFCGLALLGVTESPSEHPAGHAPERTSDHTPQRPARSLIGDLLPYATAIAGGLAVLITYFSGRELGTLTVLLTAALVGLVLFRQYLALHDNRKLTDAVADREEQLRYMAYHDDLTGLANRPLFVERLSEVLDDPRSQAHPPSVAFVDIDGFTWVNDTLGHAQGDELLISVARRLATAIRPGDLLARLGGDEFAVLFTHPHDTDTAAAALVESLRAPFHLGGQRMRVSVSVGVARSEGATGSTPATPAATLMQRADIAMFMVKRSGKNNFRRYTADMGLAAVDDLTLQDALAKALDEGEISVAYQPVMDLRTGRMHGVEALARWHYEGHDVSPEVFVPIAERIGRAGQLTAHVLREACTQADEWSRELGHRRLQLAVNISPGELTDPTLAARVGTELHRLGMDGSQLVLEITESGLLGDPETTGQVLSALRGMNVAIAIDDFGTGYNTMAQLLTVRLDIVKIDQVFVQDIDRDPERRAFLEAMLMLLERLGLAAVVEGVERPEQVTALRAMNCPMAQGFLIGRPYSGADLTPLVLDLAAGTGPDEPGDVVQELPAPRVTAEEPAERP